MIEPLTNTNTGSTGGLGFAYRSYDRGYLNYPGVVTDVAMLEQFGRIGDGFIRRRRHGVSRMVARALVTEEVLGQALMRPGLSRWIEAAVPTAYATRANGHRGAPVWMMIAAINDASRISLRPVPEMTGVVDASRRAHENTPMARIRTLRDQGFRFLTYIPHGRIREVWDLWADSFEWDEQGVTKLSRELRATKQQRSVNRSVWFSAIIDPGTDRIVALATAERLDVPLISGVSVPIVENTEWRRSGTNRHGLAAAAASHVNAQVIEDIGALNPVIVAETNFLSGAHHVGFASGMEVPPRSIGGSPLSQVLVQNVRVGDGITPEGLRDFTMMHVPEHSIQTLYDPASRQSMLKGGT